MPADYSRIIIRGDNIGARDIANKWSAEGSVMSHILRILHTTCQKRQVRLWVV